MNAHNLQSEFPSVCIAKPTRVVGRGVGWGVGERHKLAGSDNLKGGMGPEYVAHVVIFSPFALA